MTQAQTAKCEAMVRVEEVEGRERAIEHREKRVEEERAMMQSQVQLLQTELDARCEEVILLFKSFHSQFLNLIFRCLLPREMQGRGSPK